MARKTKQDAEKTREDILEAASHVFVEKGVSSASLEEIAERAKVTRGAIYWHFKNKLDIFLALHEKLNVSFAELVLQDLEHDHCDPLKQLEELSIRLLTDIELNQEKKRILTILFLKCDYSGELEALLQAYRTKRKRNLKLFDEYFERAKQRGYISKEVPSRILSSSYLCYLSGIAFEYIRAPKILNIRKDAAPLMKHYFSGIRKNRASVE